MIRTVLLFFIIIPACVYASDPGSECALPGRFIEQGLFSVITKDLGITPTIIARGKTSVELLSITPVSEIFARQMAKLIAPQETDYRKMTTSVFITTATP